MSARRFTGERLHEGDALFGVDLTRHQAAYALARSRLRGGRALDLGSGSGHGTALLAGGADAVIGVDRVAPDARARASGAAFVRADLAALPFRPGAFSLVASFQVIEHLVDPSPYVDAIARLLAPEGVALITTPNVRMSDRVNPYHVHEYEAEELRQLLSRRFARVELLGIGMSEPVRAYMAARSRRIRRIVRLDPLRLRDRLPHPLVHALFAAFARLVRRRTRRAEGTPEVGWRDFPIGPARDDCLDLLALCREPR